MSQTTLENPSSFHSPAKLTYEQFLQWDGENQHVEWVDGKVIPMPPISFEDQDVGVFLVQVLGIYVSQKKLGKLLYDPFQMKTGPDLPGRAPDILFVANAHFKRLKKNHLQGPADLVVEIISPGSRGVDRGEKFYEYEQGGVPEYWLIDPQRNQAEFYLRGKDGIYQPALIGSDGIFQSKALPGLWIKPDWFWKKPLPMVIDVMRQWKLI
jgi:Uma2 family endonuclease